MKLVRRAFLAQAAVVSVPGCASGRPRVAHPDPDASARDIRRRLLAYYEERIGERERALRLAGILPSQAAGSENSLVGIAQACEVAGVSREELAEAWERATRRTGDMQEEEAP